MTLSYEANIDDVAEPQIRFFLRSRTARTGRIRSTALSAVLMGAAFCLLAIRCESVPILLAVIVGACFGGLLTYFTYQGTVKRRIRKHVRNQTQGLMPTQTTYSFDDTHLRCESLGVIIAFRLADLTSISVDDQRLELSFGPKGLCTIPLRAFSDPEAKRAFISRVNSEQSDRG